MVVTEYVDVTEIGKIALMDLWSMIAPVFRSEWPESKSRPGPIERDRMSDHAGLVDTQRTESIEADPDQTPLDPASAVRVTNGLRHAEDPSHSRYITDGLRRMPVEDDEASGPTLELLEHRVPEDATDAESEHDQRLVFSKPLLEFDLEHRGRHLVDPLRTPAGLVQTQMIPPHDRH